MTNTPEEPAKISHEEEEAMIIRYLEDLVAGGGQFVKAKHIAKDLGLNPKNVGVHLVHLAEISDRFTLIRWSNTNCITWSVTRKTSE